VPAVHHVNLVVPKGRCEPIASFYIDMFGLERIARPDNDRVGVWLDAGGTQVHLSERDGNPHPDAHIALVVDDLSAVRVRLTQAGAEFLPAEDVFGTGGRGFTRDPAGNRLELINRG
jgi:glyoxylase I family protein